MVSEMREQLTHQPQVETRNRKLLRDNPVASWELRIDNNTFANYEKLKEG